MLKCHGHLVFIDPNGLRYVQVAQVLIVFTTGLDIYQQLVRLLPIHGWGSAASLMDVKHAAVNDFCV